MESAEHCIICRTPYDGPCTTEMLSFHPSDCDKSSLLGVAVFVAIPVAISLSSSQFLPQYRCRRRSLHRP